MQCNENYPRISEIPFDSERKLMTTIHLAKDSKLFVATMGGFDELLARCNFIDDNNEVRVLTEEDKKRLSDANNAMAEKALRVLCMAYKMIDDYWRP